MLKKLKEDVIGNMIHIEKKENCSGCGACAEICPKQCIMMSIDNEGFKYPQVDTSKCINCGLCTRICPELNHLDTSEPIKIIGLKNKNNQTAYKSSSAGVAKELSEYIIKNEGFVVGAAYNKDFSVSHRIVSTIEKLEVLSGSKYQQSDINHVYTEIKNLLNKGKRVLFIGTPCQVSGLKHFLRKKYQNLFTCDLICHGVPSPKVFHSYLCFIESKYKRKIANINMRDKTNGWDKPGIRIYFTDGFSIYKNKETNLFNCIYSVHYATRPSCHKCLYANMKREGDITIGDFWGIEKIHPDFYDRNGVSLVLINNKKGEALIKNVIDKFDTFSSNKEECIQPNLAHPAPISPVRKKFFEDFNKLNFEDIAQKYLDYGSINLYKSYIRRICRKFHLPVFPLFKSTIIKNK